MKTVIAHLQGLAPLQFGAALQSKKNSGESDDAFEERAWKERAHVKDGNLFIPPLAIKKSLETAARFRSETVPGKGKATWTKHFASGVMCVEPMWLSNGKGPITEDKVEKLRLFVPSDGRKGGGRRVYRNFPMVREWETTAELVLLDPILIEDRGLEKVEEYLGHAGQFIGMLAFRPENGGYFGRFKVTKFEKN